MTGTRRTLTALTCGAALVAATVGGGATAAADDSGSEGDLADKTAQQISDDALHELLAAKSLRLRSATSTDPTRLDLTLDRDGNCAGHISRGPLGRVDLIKRGKDVWLKPDAAFWKSQLPGGDGTAAARVYQDRFLHGTTDDAFLRGLTAACNLRDFQQEVVATPEPSAPPPSPSSSPSFTLTKGRPTTEEGTPVLPVTETTRDAAQTVYVAIEGRHYPRKLVTEIDHQTGTIQLSDYGRPVPSHTPGPGATADISALEGPLQSV
ncbi:hypothetical protein GCM10010211_56350 [Streptomyces albospinus]|uniref:Lipoprotein n=1 Tax=Streptomyces albospinus TaxID=285515 RepID=A0ABQ2VFS3_9ACTN|nr:hypothetical protein [Streptomyces albospinus]GGU83111.1 hypothetical protein GCM10010211_56350 [Streptomyces albospinus]